MSRNRDKEEEMKTRIKDLIKEKGYSLKEFSEKIGMSYPALYQIINGQPSMPSLIKISEALGVELWELFVDGREVATRYADNEVTDNRIICPKCGARFKLED